MNLIGNLIWILFGGFFSFLGYMIGGIILCFTIVGIPFGIQCFKLGMVSLAPFGVQFSDSPHSGGCLYAILNIIWILCGGIWVALSHVLFGLLLCCTVIGIPFGMQHFKLVGIALTPFGKEFRRVD